MVADMIAKDNPLPHIINLHTFREGGITFIKVDRSTLWGNPFIMESERDRQLVCDQFESYAHWRLTIDPDWLIPLRGKNLACWCAPKRCHAETLLRLANVSQPTRIEYSAPKLVFKHEPECESKHKVTTILTDDSCGGFWTFCVECGWVTGGGMMGHN